MFWFFSKYLFSINIKDYEQFKKDFNFMGSIYFNIINIG